MRFGNPARDRQSESCAAGGVARRVEPHEALEDALALRDVNAAPRIGHRDGRASVDNAQRQMDTARLGRVFDRILQEVQRELADERFINVGHDAERNGRVQRDAFEVREHTPGDRAFVEHLVEETLLQAQAVTAGVGAREHEHVVDHARQPTGLRRDNVQRVAVFVFVAMRPGQRDLSSRPRGTHRRSEFVRRVGHELALDRHAVSDAIEEPIERAAQLSDFVVHVAAGQTRVE